jgi:hypothetical protein
MKKTLLLTAVVLVGGAFTLLPISSVVGQNSQPIAHSKPDTKKPEEEPEKGKPKTVNVRDHRTPKAASVRDHRAQPEVRDHRAQPTVRDQRAAKPAARTPKQGGVSVKDSAPRDRGSKDAESGPKTPNEIVRDFLGGFGIGRPRQQN